MSNLFLLIREKLGHDGAGFGAVRRPPQRAVIDDFVAYIDGISTKTGIKWLRVDTLRVNPEVAKRVLTKPTTTAVTDLASTGSITGRVTQELIALRRAALQSGEFSFPQEISRHGNLLTSKLHLGRRPLSRTINHCISTDEINALRHIWLHPEEMRFVRISPMGEGKDLTLESVQRNLERKRQRGICEYVVYEFEYAGHTWVVKTEHHSAGFEQFYHIRRKEE